MTDAIEMLRLDAIEVSPRNPRRHFSQDSLADLADSIAEHGVLQPIVVTPVEGHPGRYVLVAGERRWCASRLAGKAEIPSIIKRGDKRALRGMQFDENMQWVHLAPVEETQALRDWQEDFGDSFAQIALRIKRSAEFVRGRLALLRLPCEVQEAVDAGEISVGAAEQLLRIDDRDAQRRIAAQVVREELTVEQTRELVQRHRVEQRRLSLLGGSGGGATTSNSSRRGGGWCSRGRPSTQRFTTASGTSRSGNAPTAH